VKILMLCYNTTGKGTYWRALQLARGLAQRGHAVTVLSTSRDRHLRFAQYSDTQAGVTLVESPDLMRGPLRSGWDPYNVLARMHWGRDRHYELVHAFESRPTVIYPALAWQRQGAKLVLDWCDWFGAGGSVEERPSRFVRALLRPVETYFEDHFRTRADGTTVINSLLTNRAKQLGVRPETIFYLPNGSDVDLLHPIPQNVARRKLRFPLDIPLIGYIGAIFQRDAWLMAQAFNLLKLQESRARLLLMGYCNIEVERLTTAPRDVIRTGRLNYDQISLYMSACDVCWLPLRNSGANRGRFPLKLNDYMAVGKPVVATAVGDVAPLLQRGEFGLLCQDTPQDLVNKTMLLLNDPDRSQLLGQQGRVMAEREFRWSQIVNRLDEFYQRVLQRQWD
jgi:glycosyltransferase involved in cell wall biosynthesis